ncbi:broad-minded protein-domain-containing protein, partial [Cladochytrium replicatum]
LSTGVMPGYDDLKSVLTSLNSRNSAETRYAAMEKMKSFSASDLCSGEFWLDAKQILEAAIIDPETEIGQSAIRIYARAFRGAPPQITGEIYLSLVSGLLQLFEIGQITKLNEGIKFDDQHHQFLLKTFRLLDQFMIELPSCWFRFSEQLFKEIMGVTFRLLKTTKRLSSSAALVSPFHWLSIVDPGGNWFQKWFISRFGRAQVVGYMQKTGFTSDIAEYAISFLASLPLPAVPKEISGASDELVVVDVVDGNEEADSQEQSSRTHAIVRNDVIYLHALSCIRVLGKLSLCSAGRACFPIAFPPAFQVDPHSPIVSLLFQDKSIPARNRSDRLSLSLHAFMRVLIRLSYLSPKCGLLCSTDQLNDVEKEHIVFSNCILKIIREIGGADAQPANRNLQSEGIKELLLPVQYFLDNISVDGFHEQSFISIAETLASIASTESGRRFLLRGGSTAASSISGTLDQPDKTSTSHVAHVVAKLVKDTLDNPHNRSFSLRALGTFIFFLRLLYSTCEGLHHLKSYAIHRTLAGCLSAGDGFKWSSDPLKDWRITCIDNLLNFAGTPKGVLMLDTTGVMEQCVAYMFHRYQKKAQVSRCEKFGYGVLASQLSATEPGMRALCATGLTGSFIMDLWTHVIHCDVPFGSPHYRADSYGRNKIILNTMKLFSSFPGLVSALRWEDVKKSNLQDGSRSQTRNGTFSELMETVIIVDLKKERDPFFIFEDSHQIALRILMVVASSLDSFLVLQTKFRFVDALMRLQRASRLKQGCSSAHDVHIIDEHTILRNSLLVAAFTTGGPSERCVPPANHTLRTKAFTPIFSRLPLPSRYNTTPFTCQGFCTMVESSPCTQCYHSTNHCYLTLFLLKDACLDSTKSKETLPIPLIREALPLFFGVIANKPELTTSNAKSSSCVSGGFIQLQSRNSKTSNKVSWNAVCDAGVTLTTRYGARLMNEPNIKNLHEKLRQICIKQFNFFSTDENSPSANFAGFDWFTATIAIVFKASQQKTLEVLGEFAKWMPSLFVWHSRGIAYQSISKERSQSAGETRGTIPLVYSVLSHVVEGILEEELPSVSSAFTLAGCTPSQITQRWLRECFWNVLDFPDVCRYILLSLFCGVDYQIYFCLAVFKHLSDRVLAATRDQELIVFLHLLTSGETQIKPSSLSNSSEKEKNGGDSSALKDDEKDKLGQNNALATFRVANYVTYMLELKQKYRSFILSEMEEAL